ncbi:MAG TPA: SsrA-binding protein SmpB [Clostridia bacterium]|jgi:SsrA-binding protein
MEGIKIVAENRQARHEYFVLDTYEAGVVLKGDEVKSIRQGAINLKDSFAVITKGEVFLRNCHITPYEKGSYFNSEARRDRKLLLNRSEISKLTGKVSEKGLTLIPLKVYFKGSLVKVELGLCQGKKLYDKRETLKRKTQEREAQRAIKEYY